MLKKTSWATRVGFYLAAIGSACGLGNLWRFPYVVGENGGGAFVLLYVFLALLIGMPILIGELTLGKSTGRSVITSVSMLEYKGKRRFKWIAAFPVLLSLVILSYYAVISGWVLHFVAHFVVQIFGMREVEVTQIMSGLSSNWLLQMGLASVHLLFTIIVVSKGLQNGVERWIGMLMSVFAVLLVILIVKSLSLPTSNQALRFIFYPDFSKLTKSSLIHGIGHVCFTLSVGFGLMVTFGSYLKESEHIPTAGFRVVLLDTILSLFGGLLVFPIALQASNIPLTDPGLLFETLPKFLHETKGGLTFGLAFFVCLYLAALGASLGLLEVIVANWTERRKVTRKYAAWGAGIIALVLASLPAMSGSLLRGVKFQSRTFLEILDSLLINWALPLAALGMAIAISYGLPRMEKEKLFIKQDKMESASLFPHWVFVLKWIVPGVITLGLLLQLWDVL